MAALLSRKVSSFVVPMVLVVVLPMVIPFEFPRRLVAGIKRESVMKLFGLCFVCVWATIVNSKLTDARNEHNKWMDARESWKVLFGLNQPTMLVCVGIMTSC